MFHIEFQHISSIKCEILNSPFYGMKSQNEQQFEKENQRGSNASNNFQFIHTTRFNTGM